MLEYLTDHHLPCHSLPKLATSAHCIDLKNGCLMYNGRTTFVNGRMISVRKVHPYLYLALLQDGTEVKWDLLNRPYYDLNTIPDTDEMVRVETLILYLM